MQPRPATVSSQTFLYATRPETSTQLIRATRSNATIIDFLRGAD
jgi:hypothetical protein